MALVAEGIAPDYLLKPDPSNNPSEDIPRLPDWDYTAEGWERPNDNPIGGTSFFLLNKDFRFDPTNYTLTYFNNIGQSYTTRYYTPTNYKLEWDAYIIATTPTPPLTPNGLITRPFPGLGTMTVSGAYNYSFTFSGNPTTCAVLVAPMTDTTGWGRPIPAPTQVAPPNNNYVEQTGAWLRAYWTGILRRSYDFAVQFPTFAQEYDIELDQNTTAVSITMTNCAGLNSGNAIFISADIPLTAQNTKVFANNLYLVPVYRPNGELYITCNHATSSADTFIVIFENAQMEWISLWKSIGWTP